MAQRKKLECPRCGWEESDVVNSRKDSHFNAIRRLRRCGGCKASYETLEVPATSVQLTIHLTSED